MKITKDLRDADLRGADLREADLQGVDLRGASLQGADLRGANLREADLQGVNLQSAILQGANLEGANLGGANFDNCILASGESLISIGRPDGWETYTYHPYLSPQRIKVGCKSFTLSEARSYWDGKENRREVLAAVEYAAAIGRSRSWRG